MILVDNFDEERTVNFRPQRDPPARLPGAEPAHTLLLLNEQGTATRIPLPEGLLLAGRSAPAELILSGATVSRRHCQFERRGDDIVLSDLNSTNGTFVDNARVETEMVLRHGARIAIGEHSLRYYRGTIGELGGQRLVIDVDERKMATEVAEITGSDYFRTLLERTRAQALRRSAKARE